MTVDYSPNLPLRGTAISPNALPDSRWASPLHFLTILIIASCLFLAGQWLPDLVAQKHVFANLSPKAVMLIMSMIPPFIILMVILMAPMASSPIAFYQRILADRPHDPTYRWNLAVVATAHVCHGEMAQSEWLSLFPWLPEADRFTAYQYIKRIRYRLQSIAVIASADLVATVVASFCIAGASLWRAYPRIGTYDLFEAVLQFVALMFTMSLVMLYLLIQRWQHLRRLSEIEEVFEELLPSTPPPNAVPPKVDEVQQWSDEQEELRRQRAQRRALEQTEKEKGLDRLSFRD